MRNPGLAAVLNPVIPGVGQTYNGRIMADVPWLITAPGLRIGHVIAFYTACSYARDHRFLP